MLNDIIKEMRAKREGRLPMTLTSEENSEVLAALEAKPQPVPEVKEEKAEPARPSTAKRRKKGK